MKIKVIKAANCPDTVTTKKGEILKMCFAGVGITAAEKKKDAETLQAKGLTVVIVEVHNKRLKGKTDLHGQPYKPSTFIYSNFTEEKEKDRRPDILQVSAQGIRGGKFTTAIKGQAKLIVCKGYNEPDNSVTIDTYQGSGHNYRPAETALINITFADGQQFNGTFEQLKAKLKL